VADDIVLLGVRRDDRQAVNLSLVRHNRCPQRTLLTRP
jgi:hypothetical protein